MSYLSKKTIGLFLILIFANSFVFGFLAPKASAFHLIPPLNDFDSDGILDADDPRPTVPDAPNADPDHDGKPNKTDTDDDNDGTSDTDDDFPWDNDNNPANNGNGPAPSLDTPPNITTPTADPNPNTLSNTQSQGGDTHATYKLLEPLGTPNGKLTEFTTGDPCPFVRYLNIVIEIFLGICAVLAMVMIIAGGFEYVTSELPSFKKNGKERITNAVFGFIIALAAFVLLNTVNPKLLDLCPKIPQAVLNFVASNSINDKEITPGNIARCTEITDPNHPCNPQNLANYFGDKAADMSKICNVESAGNSAAESGSDVGTDGTVFSFGLFQINLLANGEYVGPECKGLFMTSSAGQDIPPAKYIQKDSAGKYHYNAMLKPGKEAQYNACKAKLLDPQTNLDIAKKLFDLGGKMGTKWGSMHAWMGDYGVCGSAFD